MLDESSQIQVAEVFLGGLLRPLDEITPKSDSELISYGFMEGVRAELLTSLIIPERDEVLDRVSRYVARGLGLSLREFIGLVKNPESVAGKDREGLIQPFAEVTREILGELVGLPNGFTVHTEEVEVATVKVLKGDEAALFEQISWLMDSNPISQAQLYQGMKAEMDNLSSKYPSLVIAGILQNNPNYLSVFRSETVFVDSTGQITTRQAVEASYFVVNTYALTDNQESLDSEKLEPYLIKMMVIPPGEFLMGAPASEKGSTEDERPQHKVNLSSFYMSQTPITQAQWRAIASVENLKVNIDLELEPSRFKGDNLPVESVNWDQAVEFCQRLSNLIGLNYHLPSEAQWEYACRGFNTLRKAYPPFHFGDTLTSELANYNGTETYADEPQGTYREKTTPVRMFPPNTYGLYDLHGNVWEWCADDWHDNYDGAPSDGRPWRDNKKSNRIVMRGGSWFYRPNNCRSAYRYYFFYWRDVVNINIGFRVVCVVGRTL
jgi:formylglycine-generating enzyme required for sulfatase activity